MRTFMGKYVHVNLMNTSGIKKVMMIASYAILIIAIIVLISLYISGAQTIKFQSSNMEKLEKEKIALEDELKQTKYNLATKSTQLNNTKQSLANRESELASANAKVKTLTADVEYWKTKYLAYDPDNVTYLYTFDSVGSLLAAIKSNPEAYHKKQIKISGMMFVYKGIVTKYVGLIDYKGESFKNMSDSNTRIFFKNKVEAKEGIAVELSSDLQYTVAETGYVNMYGTVNIANGEITLINCEYFN